MRFAKQIFRKIDQQANTCAEIDSTDLLIENEDKESDADEPNVDDELKAISGESEDNGGVTSATYDNSLVQDFLEL